VEVFLHIQLTDDQLEKFDIHKEFIDEKGVWDLCIQGDCDLAQFNFGPTPERWDV